MLVDCTRLIVASCYCEKFDAVVGGNDKAVGRIDYTSVLSSNYCTGGGLGDIDIACPDSIDEVFGNGWINGISSVS